MERKVSPGALLFAVVICSFPSALPQKSSTPEKQNPSFPALSRRTPSHAKDDGKFYLDTVVVNPTEEPMSGLPAEQFMLLDNKKPQQLLSVQAVDGTTGKGEGGFAEPPVEVVLLLDMVNTPAGRVAFAREQIERFLHQADGHLVQPTALVFLTGDGLKGHFQPTTDGNVLARLLEQTQIALPPLPVAGFWNPSKRMWLSLQSLSALADLEGKTPGRKLMLWIGQGWPMEEFPFVQIPASTRQDLFNAAVELSQALHESRITLYAIHPIDQEHHDSLRPSTYHSFLKGVRSPKQMDPGNLGLPVLAIQSGGRALDVPGDLLEPINRCVQEARAYYVLSFQPPIAQHMDEYHELEVTVTKPGLTARTSAGYYAVPLPKP
jgi:VWFA-related protein